MPASFVSNRDESVPLLATPWMERLSHVHPVVPVILFVPLIAFFLVRAISGVGALLTLGLVPIGIVAWTLTEYVMHRFAFHFEPRSALGKRIHFLAHGVHHDYPRDSTRLVMPPAVSVPLAVVFAMAFRMGTGVYADGLSAGFAIGYLSYDMIHFATHHWPMRSKLGAPSNATICCITIRMTRPRSA